MTGFSISEMLQSAFNHFKEKYDWSDAMIRIKQGGHTREVADLPYCHDGRATAAYYLFAQVLDEWEEQQGLDILYELEKLQVKNAADPHYGGMRWYREESRIQDSNATFFIMYPLVLAKLCYPGQLPESHHKVLDAMFERGLAWFEREIEHARMYYPNKVVSDGALLAALAALTGNDTGLGHAAAFFERWVKYTSEQGWGWGENTSVIYNVIIWNALQLAILVLREHYPELTEQLSSTIDRLMDYIRFHGVGEFVPTIRSYNFGGETRLPSFLWVIAGLIRETDHELQQDFVLPQWEITNILGLFLMNDEDVPEGPEELPVPRTRSERIFRESHAYTWIGRTGRLGSISRFPVMPGCYQWPAWGLGWQSFPVGFGVEGHQVGYLRWFVDDGEQVRTHPAQSKKAYLNTALFKEEPYPSVETRSAQNGNLLIVLRSVYPLRNEMAELSDEWVIHRFAGEIHAMDIGGRAWTLLVYPECCIAITALNGLAFDRRQRSCISIETVREESSVRLRQVLYRGEIDTVVWPKLEAGWAVCFLDGITSVEEAKHDLEKTAITDKYYSDGEMPRMFATEIRDMHMETPDGEVRLYWDPHTNE